MLCWLVANACMQQTGLYVYIVARFTFIKDDLCAKQLASDIPGYAVSDLTSSCLSFVCM